MDKESFFQLVGQYEDLKEQIKQVKEKLDFVMSSMKVGEMFQDEVTGVVYKIIIPDGTFVSFSRIGYSRTKKMDEVRGSLSKNEAESAGFTLKKA
jgi:hypothetical protein